MSNAPGPHSKTTRSRGGPSIEWNDEQMKSSYANISNVASTREEVSVFFGTNETWQAGSESVVVKLDHRIMMSPFAAKRLQLLLTKVVGEYEARFGEIGVEAEGPRGANGDASAKA